MSPQANSKVPAYRVTGVSPGQYSTDAAGNTVSGYLVHFELQDGTSGQAFIAESRWNPGNAQAAVEGEAQTLYAVRNLSSGM